MKYNYSTRQALLAIEDFYEFHGPFHALHKMELVLNWSLHHKHYTGLSPYDLVFFTDNLRKLLSACLLLEQDYEMQTLFEVAPAVKGKPDLSRTIDYMPGDVESQWNCIPRHVSVEQYLNPVKAFTQMNRYKPLGFWMKALDELLEYALSNASIYGCLPAYNLMKLRRMLLQMVEAGWLVFVRHRNNNAGGSLGYEPVNHPSAGETLLAELSIQTIRPW